METISPNPTNAELVAAQASRCSSASQSAGANFSAAEAISNHNMALNPHSLADNPFSDSQFGLYMANPVRQKIEHRR